MTRNGARLHVSQPVGLQPTAESRLREVFAEVWSRRIPVPGRWPEEYVIPIDAELSYAVREAFVGVMHFE